MVILGTHVESLSSYRWRYAWSLFFFFIFFVLSLAYEVFFDGPIEEYVWMVVTLACLHGLLWRLVKALKGVTGLVGLLLSG